jgi:hypothetical protein
MPPFTRIAATGPDAPPRRWEVAGLGFFALVLVSYGVYVELRSAFQEVRHTDLGCYLRAGWAVRSGDDIYSVTDDNNWHYAYPPAFAVMMAPLADAPTGKPRDLMPPYALSVAIWYVLGVLVTALAIHWLAAALEESSADPPRVFGRRWWYARTLPLYICLAPIGCTYSRGQVNILLVMLVAGMFRAAVRGRNFRSGLWLTAAICLKMIPAFLLIFPVWRRDGRALLGVAAGLVIGVAVVPSLAWGPAGAVEVHKRMADAIIKPGLGLGGDPARDKELIEITATDNQSIQAVVHSYRHWDRLTRPNQADPEAKLVHLFAGVLLTGGLLLAYGFRRDHDVERNLLFLGGLVLVMTVSSPVSHTHYFCLALPAVTVLALRSARQGPGRLLPSPPVLALLIVAGVCFTMPMVPFSEHRREMGLSLYGCLILWTATVVQLRWSAMPQAAQVSATPQAAARAVA